MTRARRRMRVLVAMVGVVTSLEAIAAAGSQGDVQASARRVATVGVVTTRNFPGRCRRKAAYRLAADRGGEESVTPAASAGAGASSARSGWSETFFWHSVTGPRAVCRSNSRPSPPGSSRSGPPSPSGSCSRPHSSAATRTAHSSRGSLSGIRPAPQRRDTRGVVPRMMVRWRAHDGRSGHVRVRRFGWRRVPRVSRRSCDGP